MENLGKNMWVNTYSGYWRITLQCPDILTVIKVLRLQWLGRIVRMDDESTEARQASWRDKRRKI
jgi:hypothetical protein